MFLARVEWLPVTSRTHVTHSLTDKCKISIMIFNAKFYTVEKFTFTCTCIILASRSVYAHAQFSAFERTCTSCLHAGKPPKLQEKALRMGPEELEWVGAKHGLWTGLMDWTVD